MNELLLGLVGGGLSGLSVALFYLTYRLLEAEQAHAKVRPGVLRTIRLVMALAVVLMIVPAGIEGWHIYVSRPAFDATVREQVRSLNTLLLDKDIFVLNSLPASPSKRDLLGTLLQICKTTVELRKTVGFSDELSCFDIESAYERLVHDFPPH